MALLRARFPSSTLLRSLLSAPSRSLSSGAIEPAVESKGGVQSWKTTMMNHMATQDISSQIGSCMPLSLMRIGTMIHNIEIRPGQGGKLVRAAGTEAKILTEPHRVARYCEILLPSGEKKMIDKRCRATIGTVSNPEHGAKKLRKAGHSRWLGRRPVVRGVAMNPIDHPHGGGEGRSKSSGSHGRGSLTPWGKPTKGGYKTARLKKKKVG
ncbi:hypothetical protein ABFS82_14G171500 [Erythranthe guttata]|uniref:Large ribosomal subunit protein uL2 C-terminal domain-containing protein n=1 Tax=Erythranthe guttata TaxID=4155 RepID=A0A022PYN0_ERYGU|nr:hypothetical protein MIMGU_mgv1a025000mg [Erythranthe guttata]